MRLSELIRRADDLFREFMRKQWGAPERIQCSVCRYWFLPEQIEIGHIIGRSSYATRWKIKNVLPLCPVCNQTCGATEHLCDHISTEDFEQLWELSHDRTFRVTEDFILNEIKPYESTAS
jgi:hypothetical protein